MLKPLLATVLALDFCVLVSAIKSPKTANQILRLFKGSNSIIALQDIVLKESQNILKLPREEIIAKIGLILRKQVHAFTTSNEMREDTKRIETKYWICHYPDSIILSAAKMHFWTLLSMDRKLLQTAEFEGILALNPLKIGGL